MSERTDSELLDWLENHLSYAMITRTGQMMQHLPNNGRGWKNGELRAAIEKEIAGSPTEDTPA